MSLARSDIETALGPGFVVVPPRRMSRGTWEDPTRCMKKLCEYARTGLRLVAWEPIDAEAVRLWLAQPT